MLTRLGVIEAETRLLAPYAMHSKETRGRLHPEKEDKYRSVFQRDRDRIVHSAAFRRLEYKTQVFVNHEGDYYRTRLTHTLEVSQIARSIARLLRLNEDLTEAISLAHDLGHTPFGHSGEETLRELMKNDGGFEHNRQGLRVVEKLERRYPNFNGLNLSFEVREGIIKHFTLYDQPENLPVANFPTLEAQVVNLADEIAYTNHDLDDGLAAGMITEKELQKIPLWDKMLQEVKKASPNAGKERERYQIIRALINLQVIDLVKETEKRIEKANITSHRQVARLSFPLVSFSSLMEKKNKQLKDFLARNLYRHYRVTRMAEKAHRVINELFRSYLMESDQLPPEVCKRANGEPLRRIICDYIAGMTDRFALDEHKKRLRE
ncbi:deoxyguanosinetriphosphate triphosphohydrolase [candidate division NPL-UPA2 bacterium Unc8]|uniref:Deoxyguanosinetriphosphate triphosphohydrolase-like protein n=1 Tax=candidate division NPL-UPA2 bacterium Unc8 TaxID=1980939 RepID=A0A399FXG9_UNCN2|nr:MAG: deoxyguanosinetriphosphate triphosphohydrolase [candidate division NPL-UPA2 bacterium Unc8]